MIFDIELDQLREINKLADEIISLTNDADIVIAASDILVITRRISMTIWEKAVDEAIKRKETENT